MSANKNTNIAKILVETYGVDSLSYFSLNERKKYFFSSTGNSFLAYIIENRVALVSGDPIGLKNDIGMLLSEFKCFAKGMGLTICFIAINYRTMPVLIGLNYKKVHIGDEAILDVQKFEKGALKKKVKRVERHMLNLGIKCEIYKSKELPQLYRQQLNAISKDWMRSRGNKERGFSMTLGRIPNGPDSDCQFVVAVQNKKILGYLTFVPTYANSSFSLDFTRRRKNTPNGLTEFLLLQAFDYYKKEKVKHISLNFAAFYKTAKIRNIKPLILGKDTLYKGLSYWYRTDKLYSFNQKFKPYWESRYLVFERRRYIPLYLIAIAKVELSHWLAL